MKKIGVQRIMGRSFYFAIIGATFFMGSSFIASKILLRTVPPFTLVGWRFFVAAFATLPIIFFAKNEIKSAFKDKNASKIFVIGLLQTAGTMGLLFLSMLYISAASAAVLLFTNPLWVAALSPIFLKETIRPMQAVGLILGLIGVALLIGFKPDALALKGNLLGISSALCWAFATIFAKKSRIDVPPFILSFGQMLVGSLVLIAMSFVMREKYNVSDIDGNTLFWFLWLAIPSSTGSFGLWYVALSKGGAVRSSSFLFLAPLFTVILSVFILKTEISFAQFLGAVLVGAALYIVNRHT